MAFSVVDKSGNAQNILLGAGRLIAADHERWVGLELVFFNQ
jgi:hypothetical protein